LDYILIYIQLTKYVKMRPLFSLLRQQCYGLFFRHLYIVPTTVNWLININLQNLLQTTVFTTYRLKWISVVWTVLNLHFWLDMPSFNRYMTAVSITDWINIICLLLFCQYLKFVINYKNITLCHLRVSKGKVLYAKIMKINYKLKSRL
jgi:hypothetical protein